MCTMGPTFPGDSMSLHRANEASSSRFNCNPYYYLVVDVKSGNYRINLDFGDMKLMLYLLCKLNEEWLR